MGHDYACALIVRDGRLLLGLRSPQRRLYPSRWDVLGGRVEVGESLEQALERELSEELGVIPIGPRFFATLEDRAAHLDGILSYHMFVVKDWSGGEPQLANTEHTRLAWFPPEGAASLPDLAVEAYRDLFTSLAHQISVA